MCQLCLQLAVLMPGGGEKKSINAALNTLNLLAVIFLSKGLSVLCDALY